MDRSIHILAERDSGGGFIDRRTVRASLMLAILAAALGSAVGGRVRGEEDLQTDQAASARDLIEQAVSRAREQATRTGDESAPPLQTDQPAAPAAIPTTGGARGLPPELLVAQLSAEVAARQLEARRLAERSPAEALGLLDATAERVASEQIPEEARDRLVRRIVRTKREIEQTTGMRQAELELNARNAAIETDIERRQTAKSAMEERLALLIEEYNDLIDARRFAEAEAIAKKAAQLVPDNPVTRQLLAQSRVIRRLESQRSIEGNKQAAYLEDAEDTERASAGFVGPIEFPETHRWEDLTKNRSRLAAEGRLRASPAEVVIQKKLSTPVTLAHRDQPLSAVLDDLAKQAGIPIHLDRAALDGEGVGTDTPVTLTIDRPISLKSALKLVLEPLQLDTVIRDEVLKVTSPRLVKGEYYSVTYPVADLVISVPNFSSDGLGITGALRDGYSRLPQAGGRPAQPVAAPAGINGVSSTGNDAAISPAALAQLQLQGGQPVMGSSPSIPFGPPTVGGGQADFQTLINLIQQTVAPTTWNTVGGTGAIQPFPTNLSIVVSQTQEVHEEIADLLDQLRRLQDLQVTIEVRFITLSDRFFERIGVDFDFNIQSNVNQPLNLTAVPTSGGGSTYPSSLGLNARPGGRTQTIGLDNSGQPGVALSPTGSLTGTQAQAGGVGAQQGGLGGNQLGTNQPSFFSIPFRQNSFGAAGVPQLPGLPDPTTSAATFGFAILSDIEAFFLIQAAQGNTRSNVMQAPKVTLFNGQNAFVSDTIQRPFVTSVVPVVGDFAAAQQPVITVLSEGTAVNVQAVVSNDRRFVRLTLVPFFSSIGSVQEFQFEGTRSTRSKTTDEESGADVEAAGTNPLNAGLNFGAAQSNEAEVLSSGTTIQLPEFIFTTVTTTVSVPDGGTVLLGGIKRLREGRNEFGVPILSKIPYINRLFKNVGIGRTTDSLMMMVTPRIIIQEEEEAKILGTEKP
jgi:general secretion pathway protein D